MTRDFKLLVLTSALFSALAFAGCSSVKMPEIDLPGFNEAAANVDELEYPNPNDAPPAPEDVPSAEEWDKAAKSLMRKRELFGAPVLRDDLTDAEIRQEIDALKQKVREYEIDDPIEF